MMARGPWVWLAFAVIVALFAGFPLIGSPFYVQLTVKIMVLSIFAMSLNLLVGAGGLVSLGHAAFFGLAAYVLAMTAPEYDAASLWTTLPLAIGGAALAALVVGALSLRTSGVYFIMVTLAFGQMMFFFFHDSGVAGGSDGVFIYFKPQAEIFGWRPFDLEDARDFYYVTLGALVIAFVALQTLLVSPFGRALEGIKANERRMIALGHPTFRLKLAGFVIAAALAGLAGYLEAARFGFVSPEFLGWRHSGEALVMVILGGMGSFIGPILGAAAIVLLEDWLQQQSEYWLLYFGLFIILVVMFLRGGLAGAVAAVFAWAKRP